MSYKNQWEQSNAGHNWHEAKRIIENADNEIAKLKAELHHLKDIITDPAAVLVNMLRGTIATPKRYEEANAEIATLKSLNQKALAILKQYNNGDDEDLINLITELGVQE